MKGTRSLLGTSRTMKYVTLYFLSLLLVALGTCVAIVGVGLAFYWGRCDKVEGTVEVNQYVEYGRTNIRTLVTYPGRDVRIGVTWGNPKRGRDGEHVTVLLDPERGKNSYVAAFAWRTVTYVAIFALLLFLAGFFGRRVARKGRLTTHANAA